MPRRCAALVNSITEGKEAGAVAARVVVLKRVRLRA
jgi:hypothetical protein